MKQKRVSTRVTGVRKLDRLVAKNNMKKAGFEHVNKNLKLYWRDYLY